MANLEALIRVRKHAVEQKQKFLAELYRQVDVLIKEKTTFEQDIIRERKNLGDLASADELAYFGRYAEITRIKIEALCKEIEKMETRIEIAREDMRETFAEYKKIEITNRNRKREKDKAAMKQESDILDDIGIDVFRRNQAEE